MFIENNEYQNMIPLLQRELHSVFQAQEGLSVEEVGIEKIIHRLYSDVVFLRTKTSRGERKLVLKRTVHHPENISITKSQNQAIVEFEILEKIYPLFQNIPRCNVPKPVLVMPEYEAYVMDFVEGKLLGDHFGAAKYFASRVNLNELIDYYMLCGVWLKKLHEFSGVRRAGRETFDYTLDRCEQKLKIIQDANHPLCTRVFIEKVRRFLDTQFKLVKDDDIWITGRHGDFGSWNIMVGPDGITVFDFLGYKEDLLPVDVLKMLVSFEIEKTYLFFSNQRINALIAAFLQGYGGLSQVAPPILAICETLHRVCCLSASVANHSGNIFRRIESDININKNVSWLMSDRKKLLWGGSVV